MLILGYEREPLVVNQRGELVPRNLREGVSHGQSIGAMRWASAPSPDARSRPNGGRSTRRAPRSTPPLALRAFRPKRSKLRPVGLSLVGAQLASLDSWAGL